MLKVLREDFLMEIFISTALPQLDLTEGPATPGHGGLGSFLPRWLCVHVFEYN